MVKDRIDALVDFRKQLEGADIDLLARVEMPVIRPRASSEPRGDTLTGTTNRTASAPADARGGRCGQP